MAIIKTFSGVREGDFVRGHGHNINPNWAQVWWKVTKVESGKLTMVNRHGRERDVTFDYAQHRGLRFKTWQIGDPREDGDNI